MTWRKGPKDPYLHSLTQGAVAQIDDTVKHREHSHSGTVTVEKQKQKNICYEYPSSPTF